LALPFCTNAQQVWEIAVSENDISRIEASLPSLPSPYAWRLEDSTIVLSAPDNDTTAAAALLQELHNKYYFLASIDDIHKVDSLLQGKLYLGPAHYWVLLKPGASIDPELLESARLRLGTLEGKPLDVVQTETLKAQLLKKAENSGYPFARVWLDSIAYDTDGGVSAVLQLDKGRPVQYGKVELIGDVRLPKRFIPQYLGIQEGRAYDKRQIDNAPGRLRSLVYLEPVGNPIVRFRGSSADLRIPARKKRASRFDFIIGLLPQPNDPAGRLLLTGSLSAAFQNALGWGERLSLEFERLRPETQKLDLQAGVPYVLGTPFGVDGRLNIFRRDSSWIDAQGKIGVQYLFSMGNSVGFFWDNRSLFLQTVDTQTIIDTRQLPPSLDLRQNGFGVEWHWQQLDYLFNPRRGWTASLAGVAGFSTVLRNNNIENLTDPEDPGFDFGTLYDSVDTKTTRYRVIAQIDNYIPLFKRSTVKIGLRASGIFSSTPVFNNEQFRLGGNKLLRGFNEESLFATRYAVGTLEYRLLIGPNSYIATFADYAYLENVTDRVAIYQRPLGLGAGIVFESKAGLFGVSGAVGRTDTGDPFDLRAVKVHLGYVNLF
jgi:outer membrane protein assembly factor BamA